MSNVKVRRFAAMYPQRLPMNVGGIRARPQSTRRGNCHDDCARYHRVAESDWTSC
jgi:hypothetical protein